jgi:hypothetical protein
MKTPVLTTARIILSFLAVAAAALAENQNVTLKGSVIPLAKTLTRFQMVRNALVRAESAETMEFEVMLKMRNFSELQARSAAGERIGREELSSKYLPSEADYTTVKNWLVSQGFTIARDNPSHMAVFARGTADQISKSLGVEFIRVSSDQGEFSSAANDPSLPDSIAPLVLGIGGLQPNIKLNCQKLRLQENGKINTDGFSLSTDFGPSYTPQAVRAAYNVDAAGLTGAGQEVAVIMDSFPASTDLTTFWTEFNNGYEFHRPARRRNDDPAQRSRADSLWRCSGDLGRPISQPDPQNGWKPLGYGHELLRPARRWYDDSAQCSGADSRERCSGDLSRRISQPDPQNGWKPLGHGVQLLRPARRWYDKPAKRTRGDPL